MRKSIFILTMLMVSTSLFAQTWQTDLEISQELAAMDKKDIVLVFSGSDWCIPCMKLDHEILSTEAFLTCASKDFILLKADFPKKKKNLLDPEQQAKNDKLAETYNKNGFFPLVVVLDRDGKVLGSTGYEKTSPESFCKTLRSFK